MRSRNTNLNRERRQAILEAAAACFVRQGFHATSMKDVCREAGMSPGTLYHFVRSKTDIIAGIIEAQGQFYDTLITPLASAADFKTALFEAIDLFVSQITEQDLALHVEICAEILRQPKLRRRAIAAETANLTALAAAVTMAQKSGSLNPRLQVAATVQALAALIDGFLWHATLHGLKTLTREIPSLKQAITKLLTLQGKV